jgi:dihydropteroate synthase
MIATAASQADPARGRAFGLRPEALLAGAAARAAVAAGKAQPLAGGPLAFALCEIRFDGGRILQPVAESRAWAEAQGLSPAFDSAMARLTARRSAFAGVRLDRPRIMGVVNVTPDSFSDGGDFMRAEAAVDHGLALMEAGADILDIGGESTRPGAEPVSIDEEMARTIPVVRALCAQGAVVSIDTRHAAVMESALGAGARIVNDVTALTGDARSLDLVAQSPASVVLMHMRGVPRDMQVDPVYADAPLEVHDYLAARVAACQAAGIAPERIAVDPGIGFGKNLDHNLALLQGLGLLHELGVAILLGVSRKSFIARLSRGEAPKQRLAGSLAAALAGLDRGVQILRVHDVSQTRQAVEVWRAVAEPEIAREVMP